MLELGQNVGAHQPDEPGARIEPAERPHRVERIAGAKQQLGCTDPDAGVTGDLPRTGDAARQRLHAVVALQRVLRRDQPPDLVEAQAPQGFQADVTMPVMGWIERSAQKPDAARRVARHVRHRMMGRGQAIDLTGAGCPCHARCSCRWSVRPGQLARGRACDWSRYRFPRRGRIRHRRRTVCWHCA